MTSRDLSDGALGRHDGQLRDEHSPPSPAHTPSLGGLDLDALEKVARAALANKPHAQAWETHLGTLVRHASPAYSEHVATARAAQVAEHIATFDPPTVLRLIELARAAPPQPEPRDGAAAPELPDVLDHHWSTPSGRDMAEQYAEMERSELSMADVTDFALANEIFMADRGDLSLIVYQTAAKERIRWLSAQLAIARAALSARDGASEGGALDREAVRRIIQAAIGGVMETATPRCASYAPDAAVRQAVDQIIALASRPAQEKEL